jgi:hypothetical protein
VKPLRGTQKSVAAVCWASNSSWASAWIKEDLSKRNGNELSKTVTNDGLMTTFPHNEEVLGRVMGFRADSAGVDMDRGAYVGVPDGAVLWVPSDNNGAKKVPNGSYLSQLDVVCYKFK